MEGTTSTLLIAIMASKDRTDSGTPIQIMGAFLKTTTTTFNMQILINMKVVKMNLTMMVRTILVIFR